MTITQLKYLLAVAEHQNFTTAAEHCFVTQPTLSMQIQKLEEELGVSVFNRKKKPLELTPIGERIALQAKLIVDESNRIQDIVDQQKGFVGGEFRLGLIPTIMPTLLPLFLKTFLKKYNKVNLVIEELTTDDIVKKLIDGHLDAGIAATPLENAVIKESVLFYEPFVGFISEKHRLIKQETIREEDLDINDILLLKDGHCFRDNIINICKSQQTGNDQHFTMESGNIDTLIKLTKEGLGMTLLPYLHTFDLSEKDKTRLRPFEGTVPAREISLIYHRSQLKIQLIEALKKSIEGVILGAIAFHDVKVISPLHKKRG